MRSFLRFAASLFFAALCAVLVLVWVRSYWKVDLAWAQILPNRLVNLQVVPGQLSFYCCRSEVRLPMGDGDWFSWPVDAYFAADIPPPSHPILGDFGFYNGGVTIPLWLLVLFTASLNIAIYARQLVSRIAADRARRGQTLLVESVPPAPRGLLLLRDHPLVAAGPTAQSAQSASVMQVVS